MRHDGEARARIVATAADLFQRQGYHATGLNQILEESRAPKGSLYHYFPEGKEELAAVALTSAGRQVIATIDDVFGRGESLEDALAAFEKVFAEQLRDSGYQKGCPIATTALEEAATSDRLQAVSAEIYHTWSARFAQALRREGWPEERASALGVMVLATVQGALLLARVDRDLQPMQIVGREIGRLLHLDRTAWETPQPRA